MVPYQKIEESEFEELQRDFEQKCELIRRLRIKLSVETDEVLRFKYEKTIEELEFEREQLNAKLRQTKSQQIYRFLLELDYQAQERLFHRFAASHQVSAFLIHGRSRDYGHDWLVNQLLHKITFRLADQPIWINLCSSFRTPSPQEMWREFRRRFGGITDSPQAITQRIYTRWKTQNLCIVVDNINFLSEELFRKLLEELWLPLAIEAEQISSQTPHKLLMFFIDNEDQIADWNIPLADSYEPNWSCCTPVKLPGLEELSTSLLHTWIEDRLFYLPRQLTEDINQAVQVIWENSELGKPLPVMQAICDLCECEWIDAWLK
ncbi:hypothetical protein H6F88_11160 [Oculatella sp. FACHB-28]|uniref:hypothetical protein n=1 Tax=Oculatella sp. FACHB-28 TaxID=2692845 RepID=UPI00168744CC|nr:hypothetical protein [Oculatella sp. FACHB-28]MBD2056567.1 hypothetical protein [Oculatella sp. FACHB-28]